ncbi:nucleotide sugar dehydrogenase [Candidatus Parcubacteria bacterium]|nr:MAG: nucleotide sugar dehydrogenase [Candidatus Parcubacteria bacterium]
MKVSVIGLGKLGACYAAFCAERGHDVIGVDVNKKNVDAINRGEAPVEETDLARYVERNKKRLRATLDIEKAVRESDISLIVVPTPSNKDGSFSVDFVTSACKSIGKAIAKKKSYHLVTLVSTVLPGDSREQIIPALERASGKKIGEQFGYVYAPSLIAIGDILHNLEEPDFLFLGASDEKANHVMTRFYETLYAAREPEHMSIESAELAKISLNAYVTMKITFANVLGSLSERIPNADVDEITTAIGKDKRVGRHYFKSGLGYGGPCFPRDNFAFAYTAKKRGLRAPVALAVHATNKEIPLQTATFLDQIMKKAGATRIGFLGVSYKPKTPYTEESQALQIAKIMRKKGYAIAIYEPLNLNEAKSIFATTAAYASSMKELVRMSDVLFVSNPDGLFKEIPKVIGTQKRIIVDPWGMFEKESLRKNISYVPIGRGSLGKARLTATARKKR